MLLMRSTPLCTLAWIICIESHSIDLQRGVSLRSLGGGREPPLPEKPAPHKNNKPTKENDEKPAPRGIDDTPTKEVKPTAHEKKYKPAHDEKGDEPSAAHEKDNRDSTAHEKGKKPPAAHEKDDKPASRDKNNDPVISEEVASSRGSGKGSVAEMSSSRASSELNTTERSGANGTTVNGTVNETVNVTGSAATKEGVDETPVASGERGGSNPVQQWLGGAGGWMRNPGGGEEIIPVRQRTPFPPLWLALYVSFATAAGGMFILCCLLATAKATCCCFSRPCGVERGKWMRAANSFTLCALLLTVLSCFGLSSVPGELFSFGWVRGDRVWAGPFAFSRANMTADNMPWALKPVKQTHQTDTAEETLVTRSTKVLNADNTTSSSSSSSSSSPVTATARSFRSDYFESYLETAHLHVVTVTWKKCSEDFREEVIDDDGDDGGGGLYGTNEAGQDRSLARVGHGNLGTPRVSLNNSANATSQPAVRETGESKVGTSCGGCHALSPFVLALLVSGLALFVVELSLNHARADPRTDGKGTKLLGAWVPCLGALSTLGSLALFDLGCAAWMSVTHGTLRRGVGFWLLFTASLLRLLVSCMNILQGYPGADGKEITGHEEKEALKRVSKGESVSREGYAPLPLTEEGRAAKEPPLPPTVAYSVTLSHRGVADFGSAARQLYVLATFSALGVASAEQVKVVAVRAGSVVVDTVVVGLDSKEEALAVASKVKDPSVLAAHLNRAGLGKCKVTEPAVAGGEEDEGADNADDGDPPKVKTTTAQKTKKTPKPRAAVEEDVSGVSSFFSPSDAVASLISKHRSKPANTRHDDDAEVEEEDGLLELAERGQSSRKKAKKKAKKRSKEEKEEEEGHYSDDHGGGFSSDNDSASFGYARSGGGPEEASTASKGKKAKALKKDKGDERKSKDHPPHAVFNALLSAPSHSSDEGSSDSSHNTESEERVVARLAQRQRVMSDPEFRSHVARAWGKIMAYLHEQGRTQMAVAKRMVRVWRLAMQLSALAEKGARRTASIELDLNKKIGMVLGKETLVVNSCVPGQQAQELGVLPGWAVRRVGVVAVSSLKEFMVAVQEQRDLEDLGTGSQSATKKVALVFELDFAASEAAKAQEKKRKAAQSETSESKAKDKTHWLWHTPWSSSSSSSKRKKRSSPSSPEAPQPNLTASGEKGEAAGSEADGMSASQSIPIAYLVAAFAAVLAEHGLHVLAPHEADAWFENYDRDGDGVISLSEFTTAINEAKGSTKSSST